MKVTFFSNYLNHHQIPFCEAMDELTDHQFTFVSTEPFNSERFKLGYRDKNHAFLYAITSYESEECIKEAKILNLESDVVVAGACPEEFIKERAKQGKLTFRYHERIYKKGRIYALHPGSIELALTRHNTYKNDPVYLLCPGSYVASDFAILGSYIGKTYKWGYFPEFILQDKESIFNKKNNDRVVILWVGRMISWKHPEFAVEAARFLKRKGYDFELQIIGTGDLDDKIRDKIVANNLENNVNLLGSMSPDQVRVHMEKANIFLFTSDQQEGWGAVLNEAMNSCCAVIASDLIGAVGFLLKDMSNGMIYKRKNKKELFDKLQILMDNSILRKELGWNAYCTIKNEWNAREAARRLLILSENLLSGGDTPFDTGPLSKA